MKTTRQIYEGYMHNKEMHKNYEQKWYSEEEIREVIDRLKMDKEELKLNKTSDDWNSSLITLKYNLFRDE